jgi:DMSO/TMAO reductase YedYZ molybdopterin-dependent catalytic subunit
VLQRPEEQHQRRMTSHWGEERKVVPQMTSLFSRGFRGRPRSTAVAGRLPPGQYETRDFPVLSAGPTPRVSLEAWDFTLRGPGRQTARWTWDEFQTLPHEPITAGLR